MLSSEHDMSPDSPQGRWIEKDLSSVDRSVTPWVFVTFHRPIYDSETHEGERITTEHLREMVEPVFVKYNVDLVFAGHIHLYQRTCRVAKGRCVKDSEDVAPLFANSTFSGDSGYRGIPQITIGSAGMNLEYGPFLPEEWPIVQKFQFGIGRIQIEDQGKKLLFEFLDTSTGKAVDSFTLQKIDGLHTVYV
jgi:hypothetical protein